MRTSLELKLSQNLSMTPQLQQAIKLLQLSAVDLQQEIQQQLESNPLLEWAESSESTSTAEAVATDSAIWNNNFSRQASDDPSSWHTASPDDLHSHLLWQANLSNFTATEAAIAYAIIEAIDDDGYLSCKLEDIQSSLARDYQLDLAAITTVLVKVQQLDPIGVGARDLAECLMLQLKQFAQNTPGLDLAIKIVQDHLVLLGQHKLAQLTTKLHTTTEALEPALKLIRSLNPKPGQEISVNTAEYIIPDVVTKKIGGRWVVHLSTEQLPKLRITEDYANLIKRADSSSDNQFLKSSLQEAKWFMKGLENRHETLFKVASAIVEHQKAFLEHGEEAMKPLVLYDIAEQVGMHESTISRVTTKKYIHTPRGIFELKYFFSSHLSTAAGGACSSTAIRALIRKIIAAEEPTKPLSDNKIHQILAAEGLNVARRTVAKYREAMAIGSSSDRKRLY